MWADMSGYKVVYNERVLRALAITRICMGEGCLETGTTTKPEAIEVMVLNEDGNVVSIYDEAWMFQFIPIVGKGC